MSFEDHGGQIMAGRMSCAARLFGVLLLGMGIIATVAQLIGRPQPPPAPGKRVAIHGRQIHYIIEGARQTGPTVVLESGLGGGSFAWAWVQPQVARFARIVAYDRPGLGWSEASDVPHDADDVAEELHALLHRIHAAGPYLMVGHSLGGLFALRFTERYRDEVGGLVLVDAVSPLMNGHVDDYDYRHPYRVVAFGDMLANLGLVSVFGVPPQIELLPPAARDAADYFIRSPLHWDAMLAETAQLDRSLTQSRADGGLGDLPVIVLSATRDRPQGWAELQRGFARLSRRYEWRLPPGTDHFGLVTDRRQATYTVEAIRDVYHRMVGATPLRSAALMAVERQ
jgi:pimeloyl-ACP methyl ester carboxylesterase